MARDGELSLDDMKGGTFTISNLGAIGGTYSTPIINPPEVAILLVGRSRIVPQMVDDAVEAAADDAALDHLRSPRGRWRGRGAVPQRGEGVSRGAGAVAACAVTTPAC